MPRADVPVASAVTDKLPTQGFAAGIAASRHPGFFAT